MELTGWFYKLYVRSQFWYLVYTVEVCVCMYARMHAKHKSYIQSTKSTCLLLKSKIYTSDWVVDFRDCTYNLHPTLFLINCDKTNGTDGLILQIVRTKWVLVSGLHRRSVCMYVCTYARKTQIIHTIYKIYMLITQEQDIHIRLSCRFQRLHLQFAPNFISNQLW